jgi:uncharacterized protein
VVVATSVRPGPEIPRELSFTNPKYSKSEDREKMPLTMYDASVPVLIRGLGIMTSYLEMAEAYAKEAEIKPEVLIGARLYPDMQPLSGQVQRASDNSKGGIARLAMIEAPGFADNETTFAELKERISKTVAFLQTVKPEQLEGSEQRPIDLKFRSVTGTLPGQTYLLSVLIPNFFFHVATAHGILRKNGLKIGKKHYFGEFETAKPTW